MSTCEFSGVETDWCDHCRNAGKPRRPTVTARIGGTIEARYRGQCAGCGEPFAAGALIVPGDIGWLAECCAASGGDA